MNKRVLVYAPVYLNEENKLDLQIIEDISEPKQVRNLDTKAESLNFLSEGENITVDLDDVEWFRFVPSNCHMAEYTRNKDQYECTWDSLGNLVEH